MAPKVKLLLSLSAVLIAIHVVNMLLAYQLSAYGIRPRTLTSLPMIFSAPLIHGSLGHLLSNLLPLFILSFLVMLKSKAFYYQATLFIVIAGGLLVWLFGRDASHIGASGVIFGLWAVCLVDFYFDRSWKNLAISLVVFFFYGGMLFGVLPQAKHISFESHLFGAIAGAVFVYCSRRWYLRG